MIIDGDASTSEGFKKQSKARLGQAVGIAKLGEKQRHKEGMKKAIGGVTLI
jgi:hypothetical protein